VVLIVQVAWGAGKIGPSMRICSIAQEPFHRLPYSLSPGGSSPDAELPFVHAFVDGLPDVLDAILVTSDLQGVVHVDGRALPLGEAFALVIQTLRIDQRLPDRHRTAAILAGDLHPHAGNDDVLPVWLAVSNVCRWVAGVAGNHDRFDSPGSLKERGAHLLDGSTVTLDGICVGGLGGIVSTNDGAGNRREEQYNVALAILLRHRCDLLVLHDGPNVAGTDLPGWPSVRHVLEAAPRTLVVRGHDHWPQPLAELANGTQVLNVEGRVIVLVRELHPLTGGGD
jgi:Icc protein